AVRGAPAVRRWLPGGGAQPADVAAGGPRPARRSGAARVLAVSPAAAARPRGELLGGRVPQPRRGGRRGGKLAGRHRGSAVRSAAGTGSPGPRGETGSLLR